MCNQVDVTILFIVVLILLFSYYISSNSEEFLFNPETKETLIERYRLPDKVVGEILGNECKWPLLHQNVEGTERPLPYYCEKNARFVSTLDQHGFLQVHLKHRRTGTLPESCSYSEITQNGTVGTPKWLNTSESVYIEHLQFTVRCYERNTSKDRPDYERSFVNLAAAQMEKIKTQANQESERRPSISILTLSSFSSSQWKQTLPTSAEFMDANGFITMQMYNKITNGAAENTRLVLLGRNNNSTLFDSMRDQNCVVMMQDDTHMNEKGLFNDQIHSDIDLSPYMQYNYRNLRTPFEDGQCLIDGKVIAPDFIDNWRDFELSMKQKCHISFNYLSNSIQRNRSRVAGSDEMLRNSLEQLKANGVFDRTILVIMSDEGDRHTLDGVNDFVEERNPYFAIRLPPSLRKQYREQYLTLQTNSKRLVTNLDLHETLMDLATLEMPYTDEVKDITDSGDIDTTSFEQIRGSSLLRQKVDQSITCVDVGIPPQFCLCMDQNLDRTEQFSNDTLEYEEAFALIERELYKTPCLHKIEMDELSYSSARVYSSASMVAHGVNELSSWKLSRTRNAMAEMELLELGFNFESVRDIKGEVIEGGGVGYIQYNRTSGEMSLIKPILRIWSNIICYTIQMSELCEMCHGETLLT